MGDTDLSALARFEGTDQYVADDAIEAAVNAAVALQRPLLVKGEPGTGKTLLATAIAEALDLELITWHIKSTSKAADGLYTYDVVQRLNDARFEEGDVSDISKYIRLGPVGRAFTSDAQVVLLIDEVDKGDIEFPNDLLRELDEMAFDIPETHTTVRAIHRPIVLITSNAEKELPDAFLRRCVFCFISFPELDRMEKIVDVHHPDLPEALLKVAMERFYRLRAVEGLRKKPSTSELIDWLVVLVREGVSPEAVTAAFPFAGVLLKQEQDLDLVGRRFG